MTVIIIDHDIEGFISKVAHSICVLEQGRLAAVGTTPSSARAKGCTVACSSHPRGRGHGSRASPGRTAYAPGPPRVRACARSGLPAAPVPGNAAHPLRPTRRPAPLTTAAHRLRRRPPVKQGMARCS